MSSQKCSRSECISVQLRGQNVNCGLLWVGGPAEDTSVDTEDQSKIMMGGWIGGRDICGHRSWWVGRSAEEPSVDTECQLKIIMCGWIGGRDICGHRVSIRDHDGWVDRRKRLLWTLQLQAEFVKICFGFWTRFPLLLNKTGRSQAEICKIVVAVII